MTDKNTFDSSTEKLSQLERRFEMMLAANGNVDLFEAWTDLKQEVHNSFGAMLIDIKNKVKEIKPNP